MFLNLLQDESKQLTMNLLVNMAKIDENISDIELSILNAYANEMNIPLNPLDTYNMSSKDILDELLNSTEQSKKIIFIEVATLMLSDQIDEKEKKLFNEIQNAFNLDKEYAKEVLDWIVQIFPLYQQGFNLIEKDFKTIQQESDFSALAGGAGGALGIAGTLGLISTGGATAGLGAAGITSGLAALGTVVGGGMLAGLAVTAAAPLTVGGVAFGAYKLLSSSNDNLNEEMIIKDAIYDNLQGMTAVLYASSHLNGSNQEKNQIILDWNELILENALNKYGTEKYEMLKSKLIQLDKQITFSKALRYLIVQENYKSIQDDLYILVENLLKSDGSLDNLEQQFINDFKLFKKEGIGAIEKIVESEKSYYIPESYFLVDSPDSVKNDVPNSIIITPDNPNFSNINNLIHNQYYIIHPMDNKQLISLSDLKEINSFVMEEFRTLASLIGASEFSYEEISDEDYVSNNKTEGKFSLTGLINGFTAGATADTKISNDTNKKQSSKKKKIAKFKNKSHVAKEDVYKKLLWLRYNHKVIQLIEQVYSQNPLEFWEDQFTLENYLSNTTNFDLNVVANLETYISSSNKVKIDKKLTQTAKVSQHIQIQF